MVGGGCKRYDRLKRIDLYHLDFKITGNIISAAILIFLFPLFYIPEQSVLLCPIGINSFGVCIKK